MAGSKNLSLKTYVRIADGERTSFGGNQGWFKKGNGRRDPLYARGGCGLVACCDFILHRCHQTGELPKGFPESLLDKDAPDMDRETYLRFLRSFSRHYYPVFHLFGSFNWQVPIALNRFFIRHHRPERVRMLIINSAARRRRVILHSLSKGDPVILLIGPGLFTLKRHSGISFYRINAEKELVEIHRNVSAHFVSVTGYTTLNGRELFEISSWGEKYYVDKEQLDRYVARGSGHCFSCVFYLKD